MDPGMPVAILYACLGFMFLSIIVQFAGWRSAGRFQRALLRSLWSLESRTVAQLSNTRQMMEELEHRRIMRDAREASIRLEPGSDNADARIDVARVNDGQAEETRIKAERARRRSLLRNCDAAESEVERKSCPRDLGVGNG
jgi:hypothetical protein